ncbi:multicopper oxidase family protein [Mycolicibacterium phocaicum]|uniref:multicopper oxidase family protein n=1 Tax=Mycolicibacterium phocaicum TaxID=319706 RepID=UPI001CFBA900|nr:multicopper oxidase family protein [Mycolicibacterium phocaicum]UCZ58511.1 multicopper oxidase family protein [Mycolicibacterium phocaicum]
MFTRRSFLIASAVTGASALAGVAACSKTPPPAAAGGVDQKAIAAAEAARPHSGRTVSVALRPQPATVDLGGVTVRTLAYGNQVPGPLIRASVGDELSVRVSNGLDHDTSVHWHGIALRNDMDGAAPATPNIKPGNDFTYAFSVPHAGTYWAHPHTGLDADYGLYLPVIIDDPADRGRYDAEWIVVLDDWTSGVGKSPQQIYDGLRAMAGMGHMGGGHDMSDMSGMGDMPGMSGMATSTLLGGDAGDVKYPYFLANGRIPSAPTVFNAKPGQRIRLRIINAGADTAFRVALAGHRMTVTHTDGFPVDPVEVDALLLGMGERYDVTVTAGAGVFPMVAVAEGKDSAARALLATGAGTAPDPAFRPAELTRRVGTVADFTAAAAVDLGPITPDVTLAAELTGSMMKYDWGINGRGFDNRQVLTVREGQRATVTFTNSTTMWHPMHLHGHTFQVLQSDGRRGPRKDTLIVLPKQKLTVALVADNPGDWMMHCHNAYHQEAGMMTTLDYTS